MPTNIRFPDDLDLLYATMKKTGELKRLDDDTCSTDRWRRQKLREEMTKLEAALCLQCFCRCSLARGRVHTSSQRSLGSEPLPAQPIRCPT